MPDNVYLKRTETPWGSRSSWDDPLGLETRDRMSLDCILQSRDLVGFLKGVLSADSAEGQRYKGKGGQPAGRAITLTP